MQRYVDTDCEWDKKYEGKRKLKLLDVMMYGKMMLNEFYFLIVWK